MSSALMNLKNGMLGIVTNFTFIVKSAKKSYTKHASLLSKNFYNDGTPIFSNKTALSNIN